MRKGKQKQLKIHSLKTGPLDANPGAGLADGGAEMIVYYRAPADSGVPVNRGCPDACFEGHIGDVLLEN